MQDQVQRQFKLPVGINTVAVDRSGHWLAAGWRDFLATPGISMAYGGAFAAFSILLSLAILEAHVGSLVLPLTGGFVLLAPILVVGLYDVSRRRESGATPTLGATIAAFKDNLGQLSAMGMVLLIIWFVWVEVAIFLFAIFFHELPPPLTEFVHDVVFSGEGAVLLIVGTLFGAAFSLVIFTITAVSVPLMFDRPVDVVTAIATSVLAVRANWRVMFGWAAMIALITLASAATFFVGLTVALPVLAYATWHCYRDIVGRERETASDVAGFGAGI